MKKRKTIQSCYFGLYKKVSTNFNQNDRDAVHFKIYSLKSPVLTNDGTIFQNVAEEKECYIVSQKNGVVIYHLTVNSGRFFRLS